MYAAAARARIEYRLLSIPGFAKLHPEIKFDTQGPRIMRFLFIEKIVTILGFDKRTQNRKEVKCTPLLLLGHA